MNKVCIIFIEIQINMILKLKKKMLDEIPKKSEKINNKSWTNEIEEKNLKKKILDFCKKKSIYMKDPIEELSFFIIPHLKYLGTYFLIKSQRKIKKEHVYAKYVEKKTVHDSSA